MTVQKCRKPRRPYGSFKWLHDNVLSLQFGFGGSDLSRYSRGMCAVGICRIKAVLRMWHPGVNVKPSNAGEKHKLNIRHCVPLCSPLQMILYLHDCEPVSDGRAWRPDPCPIISSIRRPFTPDEPTSRSPLSGAERAARALRRSVSRCPSDPPHPAGASTSTRAKDWLRSIGKKTIGLPQMQGSHRGPGQKRPSPSWT